MAGFERLQNEEEQEGIADVQPVSPEISADSGFANIAETEGRWLVIDRLKQAQDLSDDRYFKIMAIEFLDDSTLVGLDKCVKHYGTPFPPEILQKEEDVAKQSPYYAGKGLAYDATSGKGLEYDVNLFPGKTEKTNLLKEQVAVHPEVFYPGFEIPEDVGKEKRAE